MLLPCHRRRRSSSSRSRSEPRKAWITTALGICLKNSPAPAKYKTQSANVCEAGGDPEWSVCVCVREWRCVLVSGNLHVGVRMCAYACAWRAPWIDSFITPLPLIPSGPGGCAVQSLAAVCEYVAPMFQHSLWLLRLLRGKTAGGSPKQHSFPSLISPTSYFVSFLSVSLYLKGLGAGRNFSTLSHFYFSKWLSTYILVTGYINHSR